MNHIIFKKEVENEMEDDNDFFLYLLKLRKLKHVYN
jgi:hypothetical protein